MAKETDYKRLWRKEKETVILLEKKIKDNEVVFNEQAKLILELSKKVNSKKSSKNPEK